LVTEVVKDAQTGKGEDGDTRTRKGIAGEKRRGEKEEEEEEEKERAEVGDVEYWKLQLQQGGESELREKP
jgi:hypothetical protein